MSEDFEEFSLGLIFPDDFKFFYDSVVPLCLLVSYQKVYAF